ncbi:4-alpha-glucanotransferase [Janibacter anophelis]|uniref:4-alpha-glucanotransferase n=1 Tax=Janibacter anophelis TaxID=319054 RepID=UPI003F7DC68F
MSDAVGGAGDADQGLEALAQAKGVDTHWWDWRGEHRVVPTSSLRAVLTAMGEDVSDDAAVATALERTRTAPWRRTLPPTVVQREGDPLRLLVHVPHGAAVRVHVELERGAARELDQLEHVVEPMEIDGRLVGEAAFEVPTHLPLGWHALRAEVDGGPVAGGTDRAVLVTVPQRLDLPPVVQEAPRSGLMTQIYQVRGSGSQGIGDLGDLATLGEWAARVHDAHFVLVNPLHAAEPVAPMEPSPYLPTSRRFLNPVHIDLRALPGLDDLPPSARGEVDDLAGRARELNEHDTIDRDAVWELKRAALRTAFRHLGPTHADEVAALHAREGPALVDFATWCSLAATHGTLWESQWPEELHDPGSPAVEAHREAHRGEISFVAWTQWVVRAQLAAAQQRLRAAGMGIGVIADLAVGIHPEGADAWALGDALARGIDVGAPPDQFNQLGQNWSQPPWRPDRLAELGYAPFRDMIRAVLADAGGLRVDHVIGLFRLWWVPEHAGPGEGAYVRYDHEALIGILALEAHRAGALVIGEDLGVVEPWVREHLVERGILGTSVAWFEWGQDGRPLPPEEYRELCLATVTTHDLPPSAGYLALEHVAIRERLDLLTRSVEEERAAEEGSIRAVREALAERGLLADVDAPVADVVAALHRWLELTPSRLRGIALTDLVGDVRAVNQPGTDEEYPNWRLPLAGPDRAPMSLDRVVEG